MGAQRLVMQTPTNRCDWRPEVAMQGWHFDGQPDEHEDDECGLASDNG